MASCSISRGAFTVPFFEGVFSDFSKHEENAPYAADAYLGERDFRNGHNVHQVRDGNFTNGQCR
jgi:hypothetical protein